MPCPVATLKVNERKTAKFCTNSGRNHLFRSFIGKHGPVSSCTIARWLKSCLLKAGVHTSKFQAHSTRAVATSKAAMSGLAVQLIGLVEVLLRNSMNFLLSLDQ